MSPKNEGVTNPLHWREMSDSSATRLVILLQLLTNEEFAARRKDLFFLPRSCVRYMQPTELIGSERDLIGDFFLFLAW
jgi:hypothetical protein